MSVCVKDLVQRVVTPPPNVGYYLSDGSDCVSERNRSVWVKRSIMKDWNQNP